MFGNTHIYIYTIYIYIYLPTFYLILVWLFMSVKYHHSHGNPYGFPGDFQEVVLCHWHLAAWSDVGADQRRLPRLKRAAFRFRMGEGWVVEFFRRLVLWDGWMRLWILSKIDVPSHHWKSWKLFFQKFETNSKKTSTFILRLFFQQKIQEGRSDP